MVAKQYASLVPVLIIPLERSSHTMPEHLEKERKSIFMKMKPDLVPNKSAAKNKKSHRHLN